ncbi:ABC transporter permease subunit [Pseudonocardia humida]|uniref:ABC transporter permease subunit n=1 Tax=Pseudonocardia humida TaxID=2800819 RepID=A0ABT1AB33_9PSEU|nr:ABC transporter permease subunit [Pseudonocardia humida]MCO1660176.1 ABC transporter permease subunit [Pseudonocardia humida]
MNAIKSEVRKTFTTKMWWALLIPITLISMLANAFGGLFENVVDVGDIPVALPSLLPISLSLTLNQLVVFAAVAGTIAAAGEFRHRTITTTYLVNSGRGAVLTAKLLIAAALGALYGLVASAAGSMVGLLAQEAKPDAADLLVTILVGVVVFALWGVVGAGVGLAVGNQVGALLVVLIYLLVGEQIISVALLNADSVAVNELSGYLPGNAGDVAVVTEPARGFAELIPSEVAGENAGNQLVEALTGVTNPPSSVVSLLILSVWTAVAVGLAAFFSGRRDIT